MKLFHLDREICFIYLYIPTYLHILIYLDIFIYLDIPWYTLIYLDIPWYTLKYLEIPWNTLIYFDIPWYTYMPWFCEWIPNNNNISVVWIWRSKSGGVWPDLKRNSGGWSRAQMKAYMFGKFEFWKTCYSTSKSPHLIGLKEPR